MQGGFFYFYEDKRMDKIQECATAFEKAVLAIEGCSFALGSISGATQYKSGRICRFFFVTLRLLNRCISIRKLQGYCKAKGGDSQESPPTVFWLKTLLTKAFRWEGHTGFGLVVWKNSGIHLGRGRGLSGGDAYQKGKWRFIFATCFTFASNDYAHLLLIKIKKQRNIKENSYREKQPKMVCCNYASNYADVFCFLSRKSFGGSS